MSIKWQWLSLPCFPIFSLKPTFLMLHKLIYVNFQITKLKIPFHPRLWSIWATLNYSPFNLFKVFWKIGVWRRKGAKLMKKSRRLNFKHLIRLCINKATRPLALLINIWLHCQVERWKPCLKRSECWFSFDFLLFRTS